MTTKINPIIIVPDKSFSLESISIRPICHRNYSEKNHNLFFAKQSSRENQIA
jgi:hypothetical protein